LVYLRIKIADFVFEVETIYPYAESAASAYITDEEPDLSFSISPETIENRRLKRGENAFSPEYTEWLEIYRIISAFVTKHDGILMHGAVIEFDGGAYMFTAPSGTGKTTHIRQWRKLYGSRVHIVNGDKPLIRRIDGEFFAYGTPWCGKERWNRNTKAPLKGIALVERGEENSIERVNPGDHLPFLLRQVYFHRDGVEYTLDAMDFLNDMLEKVPLYKLQCNISTDAALVASEMMTKSL
jgi:hypothetical protein